jgi:hypothetical protein
MDGVEAGAEDGAGTEASKDAGGDASTAAEAGALGRPDDRGEGGDVKDEDDEDDVEDCMDLPAFAEAEQCILDLAPRPAAAQVVGPDRV